ncbi:hypothetical protein AB0H45_32705 [Streptomyces atroolivaceus]|uniref:Transposase n=1 Tax=Streptomyces atroolivaceus TaxID=66869 RepID=A0ABV9VCW1_STRAZ|nr:hypothetical protein [Streptomyces atroolivaceus]
MGEAAAGAEVAVSGEIAGGVDYAARPKGRLPWVIVLVSLTTLGGYAQRTCEACMPEIWVC